MAADLRIGEFAGVAENWTRRAAFGAGAALMLSAGAARALDLPFVGPSDPVAPGEDEANTRSGRVRGERDGAITVFKGIPYGAPAAGAARFMAPQPPRPWGGVRDARKFGDICPQRPGDPPAYATGWRLPLDASDDCLNLNVWTPALRDGAKRPVVVWIHGGGFSEGAAVSKVTDGARLAARGDVVVVSISHRLNVFGYLNLAEIGGAKYADSAHAGQLDLVAGLTWISQNILEFGGDPARVTLIGQDGGAGKVAALLAMPAARGLFHRVWTMSGQQVTGRTRTHGSETARAVLAALKLPSERVRELEKLPLKQVLDAMRGGTWTPVVDGKTLPRDPFAPDAPAQSRRLPMVLGNTLQETTSLIGTVDPTIFALDWSELPDKLRQHLAPFIGTLTAEAIVKRYRRWYPQSTPSEVFFAASTAARSWRGMLIESERRAEQGAPTWTYYVHWQSPLDDGRWGAPHTVDIPLLFNNLAASPYTAGDGDAARFDPPAELADNMSDALVAFARTGNPNHSGLPHWPQFDLRNRAALIFDNPISVADDPRRRERLLFAPVPYLQPGT